MLAKAHQLWSRPQFLLGLLQLRAASVAVLQGLRKWRQALVHPEPFDCCGRNYMLKMLDDANFLSFIPGGASLGRGVPPMPSRDSL